MRKAQIKASALVVGDVVEMNGYEHTVVIAPERGFAPSSLGRVTGCQFYVVQTASKGSTKPYTFVFDASESATLILKEDN